MASEASLSSNASSHCFALTRYLFASRASAETACNPRNRRRPSTRSHSPKQNFMINVFDISPIMAAESMHFTSGILSLAYSGRVSLMGGTAGVIAITYGAIMCNNLKLQGELVYVCKVVGMLIKRVNGGHVEPEKQIGALV
ncbi:hypothetical protein CI102_7876 [Trichoderma harzianum]|uniref:Uncharacterized protein n=1 Tax=Trichoderma harzianum CBS 226.95 TaxID=983964 RepID=A0A2T4AH92_TRIHA|nr:hypothetical protein M431DRAFT_15131 [Trichoderma harzianum CBS 226.95]PKK46851.1 hypothetical protein CI102_7876 [Trichoderma harzianum]PTB56460.1 hypothetical protein M431DRAFT_15131 [Trichoderma harzianum CBS 226.95]